MTDKPITFRDDDGNELELIVGSHIPRSQAEFWRHATPDDLARCNYVQVDEYNSVLSRAGFVTSVDETAALRALERHLRKAWDRMPYPLRDEVDALLKAIDEARK